MDFLVIGFEPKSISGFGGKLPKRLIWTKKVFFRIDIPTILKPELEKNPDCTSMCVCEQIIRPTNEVYRPKRVNGNAGTLGVAKI